MPVPCSNTPPHGSADPAPDPLDLERGDPMTQDLLRGPADGSTLLAAVDDALIDYLQQRCAEATRLDRRFAHDIAGDVATLIQRGGKRLRPAFLWWGRRAHITMPGPEPAAVLRAAASLELIQACALIHDDLMDTSPLRRGAASLHEAAAQRHQADGLAGEPARFGAASALLAGDLALVWAEDLWETSGVTAAARRRAHPMWRAMRAEMVAGQYLDLREQAARTCDARTALRIAHLKSGAYTVERPLLLGAALAGAGLRTVAALRRVGRAAGVAFQLRDDLLGVFGDPTQTGKPAGEDVRHGKCTYLMAVGLQRARDQGAATAEACLLAAFGNRALSAPGLEDVRAALAEVGAREEVETRIDGLVTKAVTALEDDAVRTEAAGGIAALVRTAAIPA